MALGYFLRWLNDSSRPQQQIAPSIPKYHAHGLDGSIIGTFDTVEDAEICGLTAAGVSAVNLPLVLHERRKLGAYGSFRDPEPQPVSPPVPDTAKPEPWWLDPKQAQEQLSLARRGLPHKDILCLRCLPQSKSSSNSRHGNTRALIHRRFRGRPCTNARCVTGNSRVRTTVDGVMNHS